MTVQSIFGLMAEELIEISYFDAKLFNDQAKEWRDRCRKQLANIRFERSNLIACRDLHKRNQLKLKIAYHERALGTFWTIYRDAQRTCLRVQNLYIQQIDRRSRKAIISA